MACEGPLHATRVQTAVGHLDLHRRTLPAGAANVKRRINAAVAVLEDQPYSGRATNHVGFRRIVASPYPDLIVYEPTADEVVIHSIRHAARRPQS